MIDDLEDMPIDDDPYCLDDEPKITPIEKIEIKETTIVNINFDIIENKIGKVTNACFSCSMY